MNPQNTSASAPAFKVSLATVGSLVLLVSFFLPYIDIMGIKPAGYQMHEIWRLGPYLWAIPALAVIAIVIGVRGYPNAKIGQLAGGLPAIFLGIALYQYGQDVFKALAVGGYGTLAAGLFLLCVPLIEMNSSTVASATEQAASAPEDETETKR